MITNWLRMLINPVQLAGFFMFYGGGSGGGDSTTKTVSEPPAYVKPYAIELMNRSAGLSHRPYTAYEGQRIADFTPQHAQGLQMIQDRAIQGSPVMNATQNMMTDTASGRYLTPDSNPYLSQMADAIGQQYNMTTGAQNASMQRTAGAFGNSGLNQKMAMDNYGLAGQLANLYGQNYQAERTNQMRAGMFAPQLASADYQDMQNLLGVGDILRDQNQQVLNQNYENWQQAQNWPYQQLDVLANGIRTSMGGGGTTVSSAPNAYQSNRTAGMIGGGLAGYGLANASGGAVNPYLGAAGGALFGGMGL